MAKKVYIAEFDADGKPYLRMLDQMESKTLKATNKIEKAAKNMGASIAAYFGGRELLSFADDALRLAAKLEGVERAFKKLRGSTEALKELRQATRGTISDFVLMQSAVKADNFRIPLQLLAKGLEFAQKRANQTGEAVDYMVDSFITGVARKSIPILDNLGISQLTLNQEIAKTGDFYLAISNILTTENDKMAGSINTTAEAMERLNAQMENNKTKIGQFLIPLYSSLLSQIGATLDDWTTLLDFTGTSRWRQEIINSKQYGRPKVTPYNYDKMVEESRLGMDAVLEAKLKGGKGIKETKPKKMMDYTRYNTKGNFAGLPSDYHRTLGAFAVARGREMGMQEVPEIFPPDSFVLFEDQLRDAMQQASDQFVGKFDEATNIASRIGGIFGATADSFYGKMVATMDLVSNVLGIINSVAALAGGGGIFSLFGLKEGGTVINRGGNLSYTPIPKFASGGSYIVPPGYSNDSKLVRVQSGERLDVTPSNQVPMLGKALGQIKHSIQAMNMNMTRGGSGSQVINVQVDGRTIARAVAKGGNRLAGAGENLKEL